MPTAHRYKYKHVICDRYVRIHIVSMISVLLSKSCDKCIDNLLQSNLSKFIISDYVELLHIGQEHTVPDFPSTSFKFQTYPDCRPGNWINIACFSAATLTVSPRPQATMKGRTSSTAAVGRSKDETARSKSTGRWTVGLEYCNGVFHCMIHDVLYLQT